MEGALEVKDRVHMPHNQRKVTTPRDRFRESLAALSGSAPDG